MYCLFIVHTGPIIQNRQNGEWRDFPLRLPVVYNFSNQQQSRQKYPILKG